MKPGTTAEVDGMMHYCDDNNNNIQYYTRSINISFVNLAVKRFGRE